MKSCLERLDFTQANDLLVDLFQNRRDIYYDVNENILNVRNINSMLQLVKDRKVEDALLKLRKDLINDVLRIIK